MRPNQRGITLVALVITIIVLLILAGVSISLVVGNNGVLTQVSSAVVTNREAKAKEEVEMAWASATTEYWTEWAKDMSKSLSEYVTPTNLSKYTEGTGEIKSVYNNGDGTYTIEYTADDQGLTYYFAIDEQGGVAPEDTSATYLVDAVAIGDYVDIGIAYTNQKGTSTYNATTLTGWRVLSKSGSGRAGVVKLVSGGEPITYYHVDGNSATTENDLGDLYKTISPSATNAQGFYENGFTNNDLTSTDVFGKTTAYINTGAGVHAMTKAELDTLYQALGGSGTTANGTLIKDSDLGITGTTKAGMIHTGHTYWLGMKYSDSSMWRVHGDGLVNFNYINNAFGVRPVVSLQSGVKVAETTGDGSSATNAYQITK